MPESHSLLTRAISRSQNLLPRNRQPSTSPPGYLPWNWNSIGSKLDSITIALCSPVWAMTSPSTQDRNRNSPQIFLFPTSYLVNQSASSGICIYPTSLLCILSTLFLISFFWFNIHQLSLGVMLQALKFLCLTTLQLLIHCPQIGLSKT